MNGMTTQERLDDICRRSGMSQDIVRKILNAEQASIIESLKKGERAALIGRCVLRPEVRERLVGPDKFEKYVKVQATVSSTIQTALESLDESQIIDGEYTDDAPEGIRLMQITSLM